MPFVESSKSLPPLAVVFGHTEITASGYVKRRVSAVSKGKTTIAANGSIKLKAAAVCAGKTTISARGRLDREPNLFGEATANGKTTITARASLLTRSFARANGKTTITATGNIIQADSAELNLIVDIVPEQTSGNYYGYEVRMTVNDVSVPIERAEVNEPEDSAGKTFSATLVDVDQRNLIVEGAKIKFQIYIAGNWFTEFEGFVSSRNHSLANSDDRPNDSFSLSARSDANLNLNRTPSNNLIVFDPGRVEIGEDEVEPIYDSAGRVFPVSLKAISNLTLKKLLDEVYVNRAGFSAVRTNLPDYPLRRAFFDVGSSLHSGISPFVGMFDPVSFQTGSEFWIVDIYSALPSGFPAPDVLEASRIDGYQADEDLRLIDGYQLQTAGTEIGTYFTTNLIQKTERDGNLRTETNRTVREYRLASQPSIIISNIVKSETVSIYDESISFTHLISRTREDFTFDRFGRQTASTKTIEKLVPNVPTNYTEILRTVQTEESYNQYKTHPFAPSKQYQSKYFRRKSGLIALDNDNQFLDKPFPKDLLNTLEGGNLSNAMTLQTGDIEILVENFRPLRSGQVEVDAKLVDYTPVAVGRSPIAKKTPTETRTGDVSLNSQSGNNPPIYVFPSDDYTRKNLPIDDFTIGELPVEQAVALARRKLYLQTNKNKRISANIIGFDLSVKRGKLLGVYDRENDLLVNMIVEGIRKTFDGESDSMIVTGRQL